MNDQEYIEIRHRIASASKIGLTESFNLAKKCSLMLAKLETEHFGRDLIIRILEKLNKVENLTHPIWNELVAAAGLHPYVNQKFLRGTSAIHHELHRSRSLPELYLHQEQLKLSALLEEERSVIVSAPTSFGKTLLIEEIVAAQQYRNIVIIQPTLALLDETRKKLEKYRTIYNLIVSTHQQPTSERNIFLFTGERVVDYGEFPHIDFFVIDEFYKLSLARDDERAATLNQALYRLLKHTNRFYLLGPNIRMISEEFKERYDAAWHRSDYATVAVDVTKVYEGKTWGDKDIKSKREKEKELFHRLQTFKEPTLIYCSSPQKAAELADKFTDFVQEHDIKPSKRIVQSNNEIIEWVKQNIHEQWSLGKALRSGIAFHHGRIPRHLGSSLVDAFNEGHIQYLFCTTTLIEGVNTTARNVVLFDRHKGQKPIDFFDYKNIVGRSGRMKAHFIGRVYEFHREPLQLELDVEVPLFSQENAPLELLIQLDQQDIDVEVQGKLNQFESLPYELRGIIKQNSGLSVEGQINTVKQMDQEAELYHPLLAWTTIPTYKQLEATLSLCWKNFLKPKESKGGVRSPGQLATLALQYNRERSLKYLIATNLKYWKERGDSEEIAIHKAVELVLGVNRNWFEYKLPKWLTAISTLQAYVFRNHHLLPGNYSYFSMLLESSFVKGGLSVLMDYDVPASALRKMDRFFGAEDSWRTIENRLRQLNFDTVDLLPYEKQKLLAAIGR